MVSIIALRPTQVKRFPIQSDRLEEKDKFPAVKGDSFEVDLLEVIPNSGHAWVKFSERVPVDDRDWFIFQDHWASRDFASDSKKRVYTPGKIDWSDNKARVSRFFTVGEVTQYDSRRIPKAGSNEERNIIRLAGILDQARELWGSPIGVTSWYRPPSVNREVGGVSNSQHINGGAVDVYCMSGRDREFERFLDKNWGGGLGYGVSSGRGFTHLDLREFTQFGKVGPSPIRWNY